VNIDAAGNVLWERTYGSTKSDEFTAVAITATGKIVAVGKKGTRKGRVWVVLSDKKNFLEEYHLGKGEFDQTKDIVITNGDKIVLTGTTAKGNGQKAGDAWLMQANLDGAIEWQRKTNRAGDMEWDQTYGGGDEDIAHDVVQTYDGGFAITGITKSHSSGARRYNTAILKVDSNGQEIWQEDFGGNREDAGNSVNRRHGY